jgi:lipopolysaccharide/colanic/teichoic acid biosynthesis glycosyltransferase
MGIEYVSRPRSKLETRQAKSAFYLSTKRAIDVTVAAMALALLSPILILIAIAIKLDSPGPIIFQQQRVRGEQDPHTLHPERNQFTFFKFRSMAVGCDSGLHRQYVTEYINGHNHEINNGDATNPLFKIKCDPRVTRVGHLLRRTSLDELPQLVNVLKGDMSLVGPRPALPYEVEQYSARDRERLRPQAGLTGLWQVSGRTCLTFDEMIVLDIQYSRRRSLWLDLQILLKTLPAILSTDGAW